MTPFHFSDPPHGFRWQPLGPAEPLEVLASTRFPALHGFTCRVQNRQPGASRLGNRDEMEADLDLLERASGVRAVHALRQVHGNDVQVLRGVARPGAPAVGDAVVTRIPGTAVAIKAADCVPVLLADPVSGAVAGAHAGWRGTLVRVVDAAVRALAAEAGAPPSRLRAVIGPAIRSCCFEVGPEVVSAFREQGHDVDRFTLRPRAGGRPHLDLVLANCLQLLAAGLPEDGIEDTTVCTRCQPAFHSYRREGPTVGRNWSVVVAGRQ
ncbi:MAG: polyphenol oxidase family protein [Acidobacteria bacterium]|nr:polyphenol oxidase family protein [Acidobacteriota bacterium]MYA47494.1 polyphenol oxidase family protein [Acidobacteriota bacterium]MYI40114.1 polyphenol oxidase family protein [Acidobacteriota bacterium]